MKKSHVIIAINCIALVVFAVWWFNGKSDSANSVSNTSETAQSTSPTPDSMYAYMSGDDFDNAYLSDMIVHHQGALDMASMAIQESTDQDIRAIAEDIITVQPEEIRTMLSWRQEWGYAFSDASDPHAGHVMEQGGTMAEGVAKMTAALNNTSGNAFDTEFATQMIQHHQQAISMSTYATTNAKHQELKDFAQTIIRVQQEEINNMNDWLERQ